VSRCATAHSISAATSTTGRRPAPRGLPRRTGRRRQSPLSRPATSCAPWSRKPMHISPASRRSSYQRADDETRLLDCPIVPRAYSCRDEPEKQCRRDPLDDSRPPPSGSPWPSAPWPKSSSALSGHLTVDEVTVAVQDRRPEVSPSTVYRILEEFEDSRFVVHTHLGQSAAVYHLSGAVHGHLTCERCARTRSRFPRRTSTLEQGPAKDLRLSAGPSPRRHFGHVRALSVVAPQDL
jgi:hypothetical protein